MPLEPLSSFLRPASLDDFVGQEALVGATGPIRTFIERKSIPSMIFCGPPGTGKTTLAYIISRSVDAEFHHLSGVISRKEQLMKILANAQNNYKAERQTILFLDEIHRWNKAQQDTLLPFVEKGVLTLIGATTENPSFTINDALLSRAKVYVFRPLSSESIVGFFTSKRLKIEKRFPSIVFSEKIFDLLAELSGGDLRSALNLLETACSLRKKGELLREDILAAGEKPISYDRDGEQHYNIISAVHKSLRDSDADAACYWIGRMLAGGEDPRFIFRRLIRFAAEDIGIADYHALSFALDCSEAFEKVGLPEGDLFLYELAHYLAKAPKNNSVYMASHAIAEDIKKHGALPVPLHIRNAPTKLMKEWGYGKDYKYAHDFTDAKVDQEHFPEELKGRRYFGEG